MALISLSNAFVSFRAFILSSPFLLFNIFTWYLSVAWYLPLFLDLDFNKLPVYVSFSQEEACNDNHSIFVVFS